MTTLTWDDVLGPEQTQSYFTAIQHTLHQQQQQGETIYPDPKLRYHALKMTAFAACRVVILGQDPYHGPGQAHGLCFSVPENIPHPPSLKNIFKERQADLDLAIPKNGDLSHWAQQGVLLLNSSLSVIKGQAGSHAKIGWQTFTDRIIMALNQHRSDIVFLLWGNFAQKKATMIDSSKHYILQSVHPSPLSAHRGFLGCKHFSKTNHILNKIGQTPISW
jgi:uracil-DNA glycosylase